MPDGYVKAMTTTAGQPRIYEECVTGQYGGAFGATPIGRAHHLSTVPLYMLLPDKTFP